MECFWPRPLGFRGLSSNRDLRRCQKIFLDWPPILVDNGGLIRPAGTARPAARDSLRVRPTSVPADRSRPLRSGRTRPPRPVRPGGSPAVGEAAGRSDPEDRARGHPIRS